MINTIVVNGKSYNSIKIPTEKSSLLMLQGSNGFLACGYIDINTAEKLDEAVAIVRGVKCFDDMLIAKVQDTSPKAEALGIKKGITGKEALDLLSP